MLQSIRSVVFLTKSVNDIYSRLLESDPFEEISVPKVVEEVVQSQEQAAEKQ